MAFKLVIRGVTLNQTQLDAITPIVDNNMQGQYKNVKKFEEACVQAMIDAGCPIKEKKS